jgi:hypothetical protein
VAGMIAGGEWLSRFLSTANPIDLGFYAEKDFCDLLQLEAKRAQRSLRPLLLMLLDLCEVESCSEKQKAVRGIASGLSSSTREIDIKGWFRESSVIGVLFREIGAEEDWLLAQEAILRRMFVILDAVKVSHPAVSCHLLSPSAAEREEAGEERLDALQRALWTVGLKTVGEVPKNEGRSAEDFRFFAPSSLEGNANPDRESRVAIGGMVDFNSRGVEKK